MSSNNGSKKFDIKFNIENIGPHKKINSELEVSSNKLALFANNGVGKSFISRCFRLQSLSKEEGFDSNHSNDLITFGESKAQFEFIVNDKSFKTELHKDRLPKISNDHYIFHTFNSDYVEESVSAFEYDIINKKMEGYIILGKQAIDLDSDKKALSDKKTKTKIQEKLIKDSFKKECDDWNTKTHISNHRTTDFGVLGDIQIEELNKDNLNKITTVDEINTQLRGKLELFTNLKMDLPEDLQEPLLELSFDKFHKQSLETINTICLKKVTQLGDDNLSLFIKNNMSFIEKGIDLYQKNKPSEECPFCKQIIDEKHNVNTIKAYIAFIKSDEKEAVGSINHSINEVDEYIKLLENININFEKLDSKFNKLKNIFSYDKTLVSLNNKTTEVISLLRHIKTKLQDKINNISNVVVIHEEIEQLQDLELELEEIINSNNKSVKGLNGEKNNSRAKQKEIRNDVIQLLEQKLYTSDDLEEYLSLIEEVEISENKIKQKENKVKKDERVYDDLKKHLDYFFKGKYTLKEDNKLYFKKNIPIDQKISSVLSDGEKSILAFCYYLAETHLLINNENDYKKLFFIIDDPISSLDSNYIYKISSLMHKFNNNIKGMSDIPYIKYLILTHHSEFMSLLIRNNIISFPLYLSEENDNKNGLIVPKNVIKKLNNNIFRVPYMSHLEDIYKVANNLTDPDHHTGNGIRQVLEGMMHFINPTGNLIDFIINHMKLKESCIYTLCQNESHIDLFLGNSNNEEVKTVCIELIGYIKESPFKEQLTFIEDKIK